MKMKQSLKVLAKVIAIPCGCLSLLAVLAFLVLMNLFKASPSDIREGNETLKQIFISLDLPPEKVESDGHYQYEGGGLNFYVTFSDEVVNSHPVLKESPKLTKNRLEVYVLQTGDISYYKVGDNLFNHGLFQFLEEESKKYLQEIGKTFNPNYSILFWDDQESLKKGIAFYEKALTLVDIQDNSAIKHIDTVTVKPGKEAELKQLIQDMDAAGLLIQKYK
ncbi:hypothetical protein DB729_009135 [Streptococcus halitosis]|uniref:Uncharacterized protein n=4 Tax=Streptococcus TaxID=1301 RepID=S9R3K1_STROR|nr:hypothetical protein L698_08755 [Streptococcus oralis subsp. tigurinus 2426]NIB85507.1 hypothetical protein [Streptococcus sp. CCUG 71758]ORJ27709.1 hypothetical protein ATE34_08755 [Streptococcus oralis subsp. tigurinus]RRN46257.1 hypothetical protein DB729_009135 [Streptococcus halitosis]